MTHTKFFILFVLAFLAVGCIAGEPDQAPPSTESDSFVFVAADRRDPFTFVRAYPKAAVVTSDDPNKAVPTTDPTRLDAAQIAAKRTELIELVRVGEQYFMDDHPQEAMAACNRAFDAVRDIHVNDYRELQGPRDEVLRLLKVATRRKTRDDAERDFAVMGIHLKGVIVSQRMPRAIVNGQIVTMGDTIKAGEEDCPLFSIDRERITVIFRNFRVPVLVEP